MSYTGSVTLGRFERRSAVAAEARPRKFEGGFYILFAHHIIKRRNPSVRALRNQIKCRVSRFFVPFFGNLSQVFTLKSSVFFIRGACQNDVVPATSRFDDIPPAGRACLYFLFEPCANVWIFQALKKFLASALESPGRYDRIESRAARRVKIHIRRNIYAPRTRRFDF